MNKPNILLIMTDQQRFDSLGCYGFRAIPTPQLDWVAENGVVYDNCYVNNPICTPSRASIFTGRHLPGHGVYGLNHIMPPDRTLFPRVLQENGYETALIGKLHISGATFEKECRNPGDGFDHYNWNHEPVLFENSKFNAYARWLQKTDPAFYQEFFTKRRAYKQVPAAYHCTTYLADCAAAFIEERSYERPFFCFLSFFDPHNPYSDCPAEGLALVDEDLLPPPRFRPGEMREKPAALQREHDHGYMGNVDGYTREQIRDMQRGYYGSIAFMDQALGKVFDALRRTGQMDNTLIVFVSDHGDMLGDHELLVKGAYFYDACAKVPLIVKYPDHPELAGKRVKALIQPSDLPATLLETAGLWDEAVQKEFADSRSLLQTACHPESAVEAAVCQYRATGISDTMRAFNPPIHATMYRTDRYKLNLYHDLASGTVDGELFDMEADPEECVDLYHDPAYRDLRERLKDAYINWALQNDLKYNSGRGGSSQAVFAMKQPQKN